jgi:serine O-acetyltransferase
VTFPGSLWRLSARLHAAGHRRAALVVKGLLFVICRALLAPEARIGERPRLGHWGLGIVVHPNVAIGDDVFLYHGVTLGTDVPLADPRRLVVGDRVVVGAGAVVIGPVKIGDDVIVGANAVVLRDVPSGVVVAGNPAEIVGGTDESRLRAQMAADVAAGRL